VADCFARRAARVSLLALNIEIDRTGVNCVQTAGDSPAK